MNFVKVTLKDFSDSISISGSSAEFESNESRDEEKSLEIMSEVHRKEHPSSYNPRIRSVRALNQILNEFHFPEILELTTANSSTFCLG